MGKQPVVLGGYALFGELASGGMASVHYGRRIGALGPAGAVAIKRLHAHFATDPDFVAMFTDEGRLAGRIQHANVVPTLEVVATEDQLYLVMEYVHGETLARLVSLAKKRRERVPVGVAVTLVAGLLHGLHAAHEATDEAGAALGIVHRDVSPHNVMVGSDGAARILDFGVAKTVGRRHLTRDGQLKGKLNYMAPEQIRGGAVDRRTDLYAASIVLWELIAGRPLFDGVNEAVIMTQVLQGVAAPPSKLAAGVSPALDAIVMRGLERPPPKRFASAREMAIALERSGAGASAAIVGAWVERLAGGEIRRRAEVIAGIERDSMPAAPAQSVARDDAANANSRTPEAAAVVTPAPRDGSASTIGSSVRDVWSAEAHGARRRLAIGLVGAGGLVFALLVGVVVWPAATVNVQVTPAARAAAAEPRASDAHAVAVPDAERVAPPLASAPTPAPSPSPSPPPSVASRVAASAPTPALRVPAAHGAPATHAGRGARAKRDCDPPYSVDASGLRHYRRECL